MAFSLGGAPFLPGSARSFRELRVIPYIYKGLRLRFCAVSRPNPSRCFARLGPPVPFGGPNLRAVRSPCKIFLLFFRKKEERTAPLRRTRLPAFCCFCLHRAAFFGPRNPSSGLFSGKSPLLSGMANRLSELQLSEARAWGSRPPARQRGVIRLRPPEGRIFGWSVNCRFTALL